MTTVQSCGYPSSTHHRCGTFWMTKWTSFNFDPDLNLCGSEWHSGPISAAKNPRPGHLPGSAPDKQFPPGRQPGRPFSHSDHFSLAMVATSFWWPAVNWLWWHTAFAADRGWSSLKVERNSYVSTANNSYVNRFGVNKEPKKQLECNKLWLYCIVL